MSLKINIETGDERSPFAMIFAEGELQLHYGTDITFEFSSAWAAKSFAENMLRVVEEAREQKKREDARRKAAQDLEARAKAVKS